MNLPTGKTPNLVQKLQLELIWSARLDGALVGRDLARKTSHRFNVECRREAA
jgi:hypothetical protein